MNLKNVLSRFELASLKRMVSNAKLVSEESGKNVILVLTDMANCILRYNVGYMEYHLFHFVDKKKDDRLSYVTYNHSHKLFSMLNDYTYNNVFKNKLIFNERFSEFIGRDFIDAAHCSYEEFATFCKGKTKIFAKPKDSCSGQGIYKSFDVINSDLRSLHELMISNDLFCEDLIIQHDTMNKLNPTSINTVRVTTLVDDEDEVHVMYCIQRMGVGNMSVDNVGSGGMYTRLSEDGRIEHPCWSDKKLATFTVHPTTKMNLIGFEVPYFKQALELCKQAALIEPHIRYVGWDIAITPNGPVIVEGNDLPGYDMPQNYYVSGSDRGMLKEFEDLVGKIVV